MALKLLSKLRHQNLQITQYRNHHRLLAATRLFSDRPVSNLSTTDDSKFIFKNKPQTTTSSLKQHELAKFAAISDTWWDSEGPFKPLHVMNPTRIAFIRSTLCRHFSKDPNCARPFEGLKIVDVGCGGGILSEPLARMGAAVTGVDAVEKNINVARLHADLDPETSTIEYCCTTAEKLVEEQRKFDAVIALEVIEHVAAPAEFCKSLAALAYPGGATVLSTINRSMKAYATAIVAAEYLLHWLPKGTHQWSSFLTPEELVLILQRASINVKEMAGFVYSPLTGRWSLSDDISVNFIAFGTKDGQ
ncbi:ubiquinone biosynthesis O-methyltransferase [Salix suchowensis]|nr:ubiquinone biosynthesis O-methyltransferase [Salix suchowensis]